MHWSDVEQSSPELAERVRQIFDGRRHKIMATLRRDGSPRVSGIETQFVDGDRRIATKSANGPRAAASEGDHAFRARPAHTVETVGWHPSTVEPAAARRSRPRASRP
jgi:hypothetical protein